MIDLFMRSVVLLFCLALCACGDGEAFRRGDQASALVQIDNGDNCIVWISIRSPNGKDVGLYARIISPECTK